MVLLLVLFEGLCRPEIGLMQFGLGFGSHGHELHLHHGVEKSLLWDMVTPEQGPQGLLDSYRTPTDMVTFVQELIFCIHSLDNTLFILFLIFGLNLIQHFYKNCLEQMPMFLYLPQLVVCLCSCGDNPGPISFQLCANGLGGVGRSAPGQPKLQPAHLPTAAILSDTTA